MSKVDIKERLKEQDYNFLRENEHLGKNIILLTTGGSHAYGTNVESSDLDIRGIALERPQELIGFSTFEQFEDRKTDTTIYALKKIINLLMNSNPNTIEILGTKEEQIFRCTEAGRLLRDNVNLFLSKKAKASFGGYATAQLRRLQNALARDNYPQKEKEQHIFKSIKAQMLSFEDRYKAITGKNINLYIQKSDKIDLDEEIFIDIDLEKYPLRDFKNIYAEMSQIIRDFEKLNHRNKKKDDLHLNKHAMHLIRLLIMGTEILEGKGVNTYREKDREFLLDIREGKYVKIKSNGEKDYSEVFQMVDDYEKKFLYASEHTELPDKPNSKKIEELVMGIYRDVINNGKEKD